MKKNIYLYLGQNVVVPKKSVIGVFDLDTVSWSHRTRKTLAMVEQAGQVESAADDLPRSLVVCSLGSGQRFIVSQLSSSTLEKRFRQEEMIF